MADDLTFLDTVPYGNVLTVATLNKLGSCIKRKHFVKPVSALLIQHRLDTKQPKPTNYL